ncbi:MAG: TolC family protein, partial [Ignavibacteria bacterium]|nr:TolC family protein [Ignavibacteria bacterium]
MTRFMLLTLWCFLLCPGTRAQEPSNPDSALIDIIRELEGTRLPLIDATTLGLQNATAVRQAEAQFLAAQGALKRERGGFDPELFLGLNHFDDEVPTASFFAGADVLSTEQTNGSAGLRLSLPIGTELEASLNANRLATNSQFAFLNPQYTSFGSITLRQPLLGGFEATGRRDLTTAERGSEAAEARYRQEMLATTAEVQRRYWDLFAAERNYAVQKLTRGRGETFLRETELRAESGLDGPIAVANARAFLAEQELLLIEREEIMDLVSDDLASLIGTRPPPGSTRYVTIDVPAESYPVEPIDSLIRWGMSENLDLLAAEQDVEAFRTLARAAGWEALPQVDLVGSLGGHGLAGTSQDVIFGSDTLRSSITGSTWDAISQTGRREFPSWSVGIEVSLPIGLRAGLGEEERLEAEVMGAEQRRIEISRLLEQQIRANYRELLHGNRRITVAREGVLAAEEQVRIGVIEFRNGRSTAFELVRLGADFAVAQERYSRALVRTARAAAAL